MLQNHGMARKSGRHPIYICWSNMVQRCTNVKNSHYEYYMKRGITVCAEWLNFSRFMSDMLDGYSDNMQIDRIDNNGNYCKENCRWVTRNINQANKRYLNKKSSLPRGVTHHSKNRYKASIVIGKKRYYISLHSEISSAEKAFNTVHMEWYGF